MGISERSGYDDDVHWWVKVSVGMRCDKWSIVIGIMLKNNMR